MNFILINWKKILNLGIINALSLNQKRKIRFLNLIVTVTLIGMFCLMVQKILTLSFFFEPLITAIYLASILYANHLKKYRLALLLYTLIFPFLIFIIIILHGDNLRLEYAFLSFIITSIIFFRYNFSKGLMIFYNCSLYFISQYYIYFYDSPFQENVLNNEKYVNFILTVFLIGLVMNSYVKFNLKHEKKNKQLVDKLKKQNKELEIAYSELKKFNYIASHDLKSPLRNIISFSGLLKRRIGEKDATSKEYLEYIVNSTSRMNYLIADVLEYSKINNLRDIELNSVDLNTITKKAIQNLGPLMQEKNAEIHVPYLPTLVSNEFCLTTIFQNIIENGLRYNNSNQPKIVISSEINTDKKYLLISVKDNGIGIAAEFQEQIFEMFKRLHTYEIYPGSGIGLAQCKKITEQLGGSTWVTSEENKGSTFFVKFGLTPKKLDNELSVKKHLNLLL